MRTLLPILRGMALTTAAIRQADPDAVIVQVEAVGWHWASDARWQAVAGRALWMDETIAAVADARRRRPGRWLHLVPGHDDD